MLPALRIAAEGETTIPKVVEALAEQFHLTAQQLAERIPSTGIQLINNRAHWAKTYLMKAGYLSKFNAVSSAQQTAGTNFSTLSQLASTTELSRNFRSSRPLSVVVRRIP
jgi:restriction endonuclease Mrr